MLSLDAENWYPWRTEGVQNVEDRCYLKENAFHTVELDIILKHFQRFQKNFYTTVFKMI